MRTQIYATTLKYSFVSSLLNVSLLAGGSAGYAWQGSVAVQATVVWAKRRVCPMPELTTGEKLVRRLRLSTPKRLWPKLAAEETVVGEMAEQ